MAFVYKNEIMNGDVFGPNKIGHVYKPAPYHGVKAKCRSGKTRWAHPASAEYHVFNLADEHFDSMMKTGVVDKRWLNDDKSGLYSMVDDCKEPLGMDEERLAFFPTPMNDNDSWHGYPIDSADLGDNLIEHWHQMGIITNTTYIRLMKHKI